MLKIYIEDEKTSLGGWIELPLWEEEIEDEINDIFEQENNSNLKVKEWKWSNENNKVFNIEPKHDIFKINEILTLIEEHPNPDKYEILRFLQENEHEDVEVALDNIDKVIFYKYTSMTTIAENYISENYNLSDYPDMIRGCIDYNKVAKKLCENSQYNIVGPNVFHYYDK